MNPLLRLALRISPTDFRREYEDAIAEDMRTRRLSIFAATFDVFVQGLAMRFESIARDAAVGARSLLKSPLFAAVALVTIALAIAVNIAAFSLLKGVVLNPLPYANPDRLVFISTFEGGEDQQNISYPDAHDVSLRTTAFSSVAVETNTQGALTGIGRPTELNGWVVDGEYFRTLGIRAELGRLLSKRDLGSHNVVLSDGLWRARFGANPSVLGQRIAIDGTYWTITGVTPAHFENPNYGALVATDYWIGFDPHDKDLRQRGRNAYLAIGRLRDDKLLSQAQNDLRRISTELARQYPSPDRYRDLRASYMVDAVFGSMRDLAVLLYAATLVVLLIAAVNIANLLIARTAAREHELVVRAALGATRRRLAAQLAVETGFLTFAGTAAGVLLGWFALRAAGGFLAAIESADNFSIPGWDRISIGAPSLLYVLCIAVLFTIATSIIPEYSRRRDLLALLKGGGRGGRMARTGKLRNTLVASEIVLAFALLSAAGLLVRSLIALESTPIGYDQQNLYSVTFDLPSNTYGSNAAQERFLERIIPRLRPLPAAKGVTQAAYFGLGNTYSTGYSLVAPVDTIKGGNPNIVDFNTVSPDFFSALHIPLLRGRVFSDADSGHSYPVAIVSRSFALQHFHTLDAALDRRVSIAARSGEGGFPMRRIVGVVGDVRHSVFQRPAAEVYVPCAQVWFGGQIAIRMNGHDENLAREVAQVTTRIDSMLPPPQIESFEALRQADSVTIRLATAVFVALAIVALALALAGVYAVVAYSVERRTHEFGIRMSIGATAGAVARLVLRESLLVAAVGIVAGLVLAAVVTRELAQYLYETSPLDPLVLGLAALLLLAAVAASALIPAWRATRVQPATALHYE